MPVDPNPANASISHRVYFYPLPYPLPPGTPIPYSPGLPTQNPLDLPETPVEPTSSLVLTSTTKQFVDVRVFKPILEEDPELPNEGGPRARLDWAFAGTSTSHPIPDPYPYGHTAHPSTATTHPRTWPAPVTQATWTHWLDTQHPVSRSPSAIPEDTGTMFPLSATHTLEFGSSINAATGRMWSYEELWFDGEVLPAPVADEVEPPVYSVVLRLDDIEHDARGVVVRVGRYCQGVVMKGGYASVERWEWVGDGEGERKAGRGDRKGEGEGEEGPEIHDEDPKKDIGSWKRTVRIGDQFLPCAPTFTPSALVVGGKVRYWDYEWVCEEKVAWRGVVKSGSQEGES